MFLFLLVILLFSVGYLAHKNSRYRIFFIFLGNKIKWFFLSKIKLIHDHYYGGEWKIERGENILKICTPEGTVILPFSNLRSIRAAFIKTYIKWGREE